jgi:serine/threonine-protein kinase
LPKAERTAFLEAKCGADENLLAEINSLLEAEAASENFIESPTVAVKFLTVDPRETWIAGKQIGAYRIEREIGRGGMGAVYLASRADGEFNRKVAVKLIKRGLDTDEIVRRFRHERQILANLNHPNITKLLDGGTTRDGLPYLVMDYVEGVPLNRYADEENLALDARLELFLEVCAAVAYAHRNLIVHRDLKPSNILVGADGAPKLLDFGIAKLLAADAAPLTRQTINDINVMTPEYASPEQVRGENVTTATDVYSLGIVLYELLTGARPFSFENKSLEKILHTVCESEPVAPSRAIWDLGFGIADLKNASESEVRRINNNRVQDGNPKSQIPNPKSLRGDLDNIVLMAMRKEPARRYSSVEQFAEDIRRHHAGLPVLARQDTFGYRAGKFVSRNKTGVAAASGIALSLIGGIVGTYRQSRIAKRERDAALTEAAKAERINKFLQKMLASADPRREGKDVKVTEILELAADDIEKDFAGEPEIVADLRTTVGLTFLAQGKTDLAEPHLRQALEARRRLFGREHHDAATSLYNFGQLLQARGEAAAAENCYRQSLAVLRRLLGSEHLEISNVLHNLAHTLALQGKNAEAIEVLRKELKIRRARLDENHPEIAETLTELGSVLTVMGETEAAEPLQRQALAVSRRHYGDEHPNTATILINLFGAIQHKNLAEAERLVIEALRIRRKLLGDTHPDVAWSLYHLSFVKTNKGEAAEAERLAREILTLRGVTLTDENLLISNALLILGRSLTAQSRLPEAETVLRECLALRRKNLSPEHWLLATTDGFLGECLMLLNRTGTGKRLLLESYASLKEKLGESHMQTRLAAARIERFIN